MGKRKCREGRRFARYGDFYVTRRHEYGQTWHIVRLKGLMGVWLGAYRSERAAHCAITTAVHQRAVDVPIDAATHPLFVE